MLKATGIVEFKCQNCGACCGPIPLLDWELVQLRRAIRKLPKEDVERLKSQQRGKLTCLLRDIEKKICSVYNQRPKICRQYGHTEGLMCPKNKLALLSSRAQAKKEFDAESRPGEYPIGILGGDIGWSELIGREGGQSA